ncbi:MAG: methyl-accepting chemotaxis protein [Xenococcaceae cyanobacterium]
MSKASSSEADRRKVSRNLTSNESLDFWETNQQKVTSSNNSIANKIESPQKSQGQQELKQQENIINKQAKLPKLRSKSGLSAKTLALTFVLGMLPVLAGGAASFYFGSKAVDRQNETINTQTSESTLQLPRQQLLTELSIAIGLTSLLTGAVAAWSINRLVRNVKLKTIVAANSALTQARIERTQLLTDLVAKIRTSLDRESILKATVNVAREVLECDRVLIYGLERDERGKIIAESVAAGFPQALGSVIDDPCFVTKYEEKYLNGRIHAIDNIYEANIGECYLEQLEKFAVKANLVVPLMNQGRLLGLLIAHQCDRPKFWQQTEIDLLVQISTQAGFALDNAKLIVEHASLQQQVIESIERADIESQWDRYYQDAIEHLHESLGWEDVLKAAVEESRRVLACDRVVIYSLDRQSKGVIIAESVAPGCKRALNKTIHDPCFEAQYIEKYESGRIRAIDNIYEQGMSTCYIQQLETLNVKANLVAPILHQGKILGLLVAHQCSDFRHWQDLEINWFAQIAIQVGYALDNAKLIERVRQISQQTNGIDRVDTQALADSLRTIGDRVRQTEKLVEYVSEIVKNQGDLDDLSSTQSIDSTMAQAENTLKNLNESVCSIAQINSINQALLEQMNCQVINQTIEIGKAKAVSQEDLVAIAEQVRASTQKLVTATAEIESLSLTATTTARKISTIIYSETENKLEDARSSQTLQQKLAEIASVNQKLKASLEQITSIAIDENSTNNLKLINKVE